MLKIWSSVFAGDDVVFTQKDHVLRVPIKEISAYVLSTLRSNAKPCGGCTDLPMHGYKNKYSWCQFSRSIANLYDAGWKWIPNDPPKRYLVTITRIDPFDHRYVPDQTFYVLKSNNAKLLKKIHKIKRQIIKEVSTQYRLDREAHPYEIGYIPSDVVKEDDGFIILKKFCEIPPEHVVLIDDSYKIYMLTVKEIKDQKV